jgi:hypothetical protein
MNDATNENPSSQNAGNPKFRGLDLESITGPFVEAGVQADDQSVSARRSQRVKMFSEHPEIIDGFITAFNGRNATYRISDEDRRILQSDPQLAERLFNGGLQDLIASGRTTVAELHGKPKEFLETLSYGDMSAAILDGAVSVKQLAEAPSDKWSQVSSFLQHGQIRAITELLGFSSEQADAFIKSAIAYAEETERTLRTGSLSPDQSARVSPASERLQKSNWFDTDCLRS